MSVYKKTRCVKTNMLWTKPSKNGEYLCNEKMTELLVGQRMKLRIQRMDGEWMENGLRI